MDPQKQREIASKGGKAAHQKGTAHEFTTEEARVAGRKGGAASRARRTNTQAGDTGEQSRQSESGGDNGTSEGNGEQSTEGNNDNE